MFTLVFFKASLERAVKSFCQAAALVVGANATGLLDLDVVGVLSLSGSAFLLSLLTSYASGLVGDPASPSLVATPGDHAA